MATMSESDEKGAPETAPPACDHRHVKAVHSHQTHRTWAACDACNEEISVAVEGSCDGCRVSADPINPSHYKSHPSGIECIDIVEHMSFNIGSAFKYLWRAGRKGPIEEDLRKARWYIDREIERCSKRP
jgi:hypothetical protein